MKKIIDGYEYMTGTSPGSLYPICLWDEDALCLGMQINLKWADESKKSFGVAIYARGQMFDSDGQDVVPTLSDIFHALKGRVHLVPRSNKHISGTVHQSVVAYHTFPGPEECSEKFCEMFVSLITQISKTTKMVKLKDEHLEILAEKALFEFLDYDPGAKPQAEMFLPDVEDQLDSDFDFTSLLGKPDPND